MSHPESALTRFHPLVGEWFRRKMGAPTDIQAKAWPKIASGRHVLATAPTGSGKTLTAFLWAINQLVTGAWSTGQTRVLYVSPLKALNNDIRTNLIAPLDELKSCFREAGSVFPDVCVLTRSGDTPAEERRRMVRRPPEILITTPESLNILLSSRSGRLLLTGLATVILDEIHAVVGTKRGTHLITAVERLVPICGEFQRIALSATVRPLPVVADFVGGLRQKGAPGSVAYEKRTVDVVKSGDVKRTRIDVCFPPDARDRIVDASWWPVLIEAFKEVIRRNRATLLFTNSRRTAEKVARLINEGEPAELAYSHHGSLAREIRLAVEERLKNGELRAIVATSSLELGIDIGELDQVILVQTPPSVSSAIQRIGRSGHAVGGTSRGLLYPTHGHDFLRAAVIAESVAAQDIESITPVDCPLDVLAQVIVSMTGAERWDADDLFAILKASYPYRDLPRRQFDLVLDMLAGRYADTKIRELRPRISLDRIDRTVHGKEGVLRLVYMSGGMIPDRGYYDLRVQESHAKIGELDEEFVWERSIGDTFTLGAQVWRIRNVTHNDVEVVPVEEKPGIVPFWRAEDRNRDFHLSEKILLFLERNHERLDDPALKDELREKSFMDGPAADELIDFLRRQREATAATLPHRHHLLVEHFDDPGNRADTKQVILHTLWGGKVNRPFGLALQAAWAEKYDDHLEIFQNDDCILLMLPHQFTGADILTLVTPENVERLLRKTLEMSGFFGARFRENAGRALLLPRADFRRRLPLWLNRLRSKKLMDAVLPYPDFPILLETWRQCFQDEFDLSNLKRLLDELRSGRIAVTETRTPAASPFADGLIWQQTNKFMYEDDSPLGGKMSAMSEDLLRQVMFSGKLRPRIPAALAAALTAKLQRTAPGYALRSPAELLDWTKDRCLIPLPEWRALLDAMERDGEMQAEPAVGSIREKIVSLLLPGARVRVVCAVETLPRIAQAFRAGPGSLDVRDVSSNDPPAGRVFRLIERMIVQNNMAQAEDREPVSVSDILRQWLSFYGPVRRVWVREVLGLDESVIDEMLARLVESQDVVVDPLTEHSEEPEVCDRENLEILLRMARKSRQPSFKALGIDSLPLFLAAYQGLTAPGETLEDLQKRIDQLFGYPATADGWEKQILPARMSPYDTAWLDRLMQTSELLWFGCGKKKISFAFADDLDLFRVRDGHDQGARGGGTRGLEEAITRLFPGAVGRYSFLDIVEFSKLDSREATEKLWNLAWRGMVTNDAVETLRQGILTDFAPVGFTREKGRPSRSAYNRWGATRPLPGHWYLLGEEDAEPDFIDEAESVKDRVRQLFRRYGLLFRELLAPELPMLQWGRIFKALRLMELSGEILSGHFFEGISGVQFISYDAFRFLNEPLPEDAVYWMNAADPASLCGTGPDGLRGALPSRIPSTHLVYRGKELVMVSRRNGRAVEFTVPPDDRGIEDYLAIYKTLLTREFSPEKIIMVETINRRPATESEYADRLKAFGFSAYHKGLELTKKY